MALLPVMALAAVVMIALVGRAATGTIAAADSAAAPQEVPALSASPLTSVAVRPAMPHRRETGTDGLMGRLPFDLPPDPAVPLVNRFTIDDLRAGWSDLDTTPPWVRRLHGLGSYTADPYQR